MLNNRITSLTCIHREAGIKHSAEEEKNENRKEGRRERRRRMEMEGEAIKKRIRCLSIEEMEASGRRGEGGDGEGGSGGKERGETGRGGDGGERVVNPMYLISFSVSESSRG